MKIKGLAKTIKAVLELSDTLEEMVNEMDEGPALERLDEVFMEIDEIHGILLDIQKEKLQ